MRNKADTIRDYAKAVTDHGSSSEQTQTIRNKNEHDLENIFEVMDDVADLLSPKAYATEYRPRAWI